MLVNSLNPHRIEGQKTAAFEIVEELGRAPDVLALPYGGGGNSVAYAKGFSEEGARRGMVSVQAAQRATTLASAIRIAEPAHLDEVDDLVANGRVEIVTVDDSEITPRGSRSRATRASSASRRRPPATPGSPTSSSSRAARWSACSPATASRTRPPSTCCRADDRRAAERRVDPRRGVAMSEPRPACLRRRARRDRGAAARARRRRPADARGVHRAHGDRVRGEDHAELEALTRDLPARRCRGRAVAAEPDALRPLALRLERARRPHPLGRRVTCLACCGNVDLDLREATLDADVVTIVAVGVMGAIDVYVPEGIEVDLHGLALLGHKGERGADPPARPARRSCASTPSRSSPASTSGACRSRG